ncbi:MAG TPA: thiamine-phosphate kinase [Mycobacteriales bacterium]|jgi:thiamine-monophosphate kinase|nr:thiamine-phosphate kinase [Mycobacteriales bacterium]
MAQPQTPAHTGEFGLIRRVAARLAGPAAPAGPGDDAAVVPAPDGRVVATTDLLAEGLHFRLDWSTGYDVGRRAAAANLADVVAMGAVPTALLVGIALPADTLLTWVDAFTDGLRDECRLTGAVVVGGDTIGSTDRITVAVTALGDLQGRAPVLRSGARPGDDVVLIGRTGWAAAGLALLRAGVGGHPELVDALHRPRPPYPAGPALAAAGAHAMCDVSDGLIADAGHLADASGVALELDLEALRQPALLPAARALGVTGPDWELLGGEDHALVACLPGSADVSAPALRGLRVIGRVTAGAGVHVPGWSGASASGGHEHFRAS